MILDNYDDEASADILAAHTEAIRRRNADRRSHP
jgi:hypothetical protein